MTKQKQDATHKVPKLRFPEFRDAGEWEAKALADLIRTVTPPKKIPSTQFSVSGSSPIIDQSQAYISGWTDDQDAVISNGLPLIIFGDHTCVLKITDVPFAQGADGIKIIGASFGLSTTYLYQYLLFNPVKMEEYKRHFATLKSKIIAFPDETSGEQQKIVDCLSSIDELITAQTQKLDTLKTHKKGLMQQLFSQQLRFKDDDGREFSGWEENCLGEICTITTGQSNREDSSLIGAYTFFDRSQDIRTSNIYLFDGEAIIVAGEGQEFIPKHFIGKFDLHQRTYAIMNFDGNHGKYLFYFIHHFRSYFLSQAVGSTVKSLRLPMFKKMPVKLPSIKEQTKIADCLSSLDDLITAQTQKINALKSHKKGLMQQLFPALDEVQG